MAVWLEDMKFIVLIASVILQFFCPAAKFLSLHWVLYLQEAGMSGGVSQAGEGGAGEGSVYGEVFDGGGGTAMVRELLSSRELWCSFSSALSLGHFGF